MLVKVIHHTPNSSLYRCLGAKTAFVHQLLAVH